MPSKMKRPWTISEIERLRGMSAHGVLVGRICITFGRSFDSVKGVALRHGIELQFPGRRKRDEDL